MDVMYLDNLDEFINDEKRIVTYRWLSLTLNVSSNVAKQMLFHYYDVNHKKQNSDEEHRLSVTYLLSGVVFDEELKQDIHKICVIRDVELENVKKSFKQIYSLHIYSIQKVKLKDLQVLYGIDYDKIKENVFHSAEFSSIVFPAAQIKLDTSKQKINVEPIKKSSPQKNLNIKTEEQKHFDQNKENKKNEKNTQMSSKKEAKGSLASMFANQTKKQEMKKPLEIKQEQNLKPKDASKNENKKGPLFAFLSKEKPVKKEEKSSPVKISKDKDDIDIMEIDSDSAIEDADVKPVLKPSPKKTNSIKEKKVNNSQKTKRQTNSAPKGKRKSSTNINSKSKRQRIMTMDSSSESSSEEEEELPEECPLPLSPPPRLIESDDDEDIIPLTPTDNNLSAAHKDNKRRKRKLVDKTFEDEQGYFVTKKEYEYITDSDEEENPIPAPKIVKTSPKKSPKISPNKSPKKKSPKRSKKKSPVKSKQATLMSFFTRKN